MSPVKIGIVIAGILSSAVGILHIPQVWQHVFPRWTAELERVSLLSRKLINTGLVALALLLLVSAFTSLAYADELSRGEGLALGITVAYSMFWLWRAIWQVIYFSPSKVEHDAQLSPFHYFLIVIFIALFVIYLFPVASKLIG